jgi:hypothetical protein
MHLKANSQHFSLANTSHLMYHSIMEAKKPSLAPGKVAMKYKYDRKW